MLSKSQARNQIQKTEETFQFTER